MQSPAPQKQKIAGRSDSSEEESIDIIENIEAITEEDKKKTDNDVSLDSSDSTITEDKDSPETEGGPIKQIVTVAAEALAIPASTSGVVGTSQGVLSDMSDSCSSSSSSSTSSSSSGGSSRSDISSSDSSDSSRSDSDSDSSAVDNNNKKKKYKSKMPSMTKSPACDGSRDTFEEWHSLWEVFGQDNGFDEYHYIVPYPDLPVDGHNTVTLAKTEKKALKKNKKAIASLRVSFSGIFTVDAMIEGTIDDAGMWPYECIHLALVDLYGTNRPKSWLDRMQLDMDKLTIKMGDNDHPDVLFELAMMVRNKYRRRRTTPTWDELISCIVTGSSLFYQTHFTTIMLKLDHEQDGQVVMNAMKQLVHELYTASHLSRTNVESAHETSLVQFKKKQQDQWTQGMQCYWCWKLGPKSTDCSRRQAGQPKLPKPGSTIAGAPGGGGNNNNNNNDGGGKTQASRCTRCKGHHHTTNCYHDPANAAKRLKD
jgi:hypothetical protein